MTLKEIMRGLLLEGVSNGEINDAIENHKNVVITYSGTDGTHTGKRMIQPVAFGLTSSGNPVIRAFEPFGDTKTKVPRWKYLRVDRILSWRDTGKTFDEPAPLFNPDDDKTMSVVWKIGNFDDPNNGNTEKLPDSGYKTKNDENGKLYKTDTERGLEKLRKQLKNPLTLDDFKTSNGLDTNQTPSKTSGPKTTLDVKKGLSDVYTDEYNYNTFDDSLSASNSNSKRNGHYYYQKRDNGKFAKGSVLDDEPQIDNEVDIENYLKNYKGNQVKTIEDLRRVLGDTNDSITLQDLKSKLGKV